MAARLPVRDCVRAAAFREFDRRLRAPGEFSGAPAEPEWRPIVYRAFKVLAARLHGLDQYAAMTAAHRDCRERQIANSVRKANDVLDRCRCLSKRDCPPVAKSM